jgi:hypothetical protein
MCGHLARLVCHALNRDNVLEGPLRDRIPDGETPSAKGRYPPDLVVREGDHGCRLWGQVASFNSFGGAKLDRPSEARGISRPLRPEFRNCSERGKATRVIPTWSSMNLDVTNDEARALATHLRNVIENDRFPLAPRLAPFTAVLAKLDPSTPKPEPPPPSLMNAHHGAGDNPRERGDGALLRPDRGGQGSGACRGLAGACGEAGPKSRKPTAVRRRGV